MKSLYISSLIFFLGKVNKWLATSNFDNGEAGNNWKICPQMDRF